MHHDRDVPSLDDETLRLLETLPRTAPVDPGQADRLVAQLRREGFFQPRRRPLRWAIHAAAAAAIFATGLAIGMRYARQNSLEEQLARTNLTVSERVLLLQRAGTAYVQAAQSYADATAHVDSNAVEVASRVLLGAAHAVARTSLDAGLSERLSNALTPVANKKPIVWF